jgi:choline dehydrogenase-like flavoprotein
VGAPPGGAAVNGEFDLVIVGSGFAGAILAAEAAANGKTVLLLEAGTDQARTFAGYREQLATYYGNPVKTPEAPYRFNRNAPQPDIPGAGTEGAEYFDEVGPTSFGSTYARLAGGTSLHWLGTCLRMLPEDFEFASRFGLGLDWPIGYDDLAPDYERAEWEIGVSADVADQVHLGITFSEGYDYPMRRVPPSWSDRFLGAAIDGMEVDLGGERRTLRVRNTPAGRNSDPRGSYRPVGAVDLREGFSPPAEGQALARDLGERCQGNSVCVPICPVQAKYNALKTLARATATGRVTVVTQAVASRVRVEGRRVTGIEYLRYVSPDSPAHTQHVAHGRTYVLACHAVENAKLMLMSDLQSANGLIGAYLQDHPVELAWGLAPEDIGAYRGPLSSAGIEDLRGGAFRSEHAAFRIEIGNDGWTWPTGAPDSTATDAISEGLVGRTLRERIRGEVGRHVRFGSLVEQPPAIENRVTICSTVLDAMGLPRPVVNYSFDEYVLKGLSASARMMRQLFAAAGIADRTDHNRTFLPAIRWRDEWLIWGGAGHFSGTHVMGADPAHSVVDSHQRSWDQDNLFLAGPGSMPTMGTSNPTLTVAALAFRTAREVLAHPEERA